MPTIGDPGAMWTREGAGMIAAGEVGNKKMTVGGGEMMIKNSRDLLNKARDKGQKQGGKGKLVSAFFCS